MYNDISRELLEIIEPIAAAHDLEIVDAEVRGGSGQARIRVVLDTPAGDGRVTVGACALISREIGHSLDVADYLSADHLLEVCSPGVDRTLGREKDFVQALGRRVSIQTRTALSGRRRFRGELVAFEADEVCVRTDTESIRIPFDWITQAQAFGDFDPPQAKR